MNTFRTLTICLLTFSASFLFAQNTEYNKSLEFKLKLMPDNVTWGVFIKPDHTISPSAKTSTGSGQVTLVAPKNFKYGNLTNHGGTWVENARVTSPVEAPENAYVSFGFVTDEPKITLFSNEETLLFTLTFDAKFNGKVSLINNETDPFAGANSYNSNPGNDFGMIDFGNAGGLVYYTYNSNPNAYAPLNDRNSALASNDEE